MEPGKNHNAVILPSGVKAEAVLLQYFPGISHTSAYYGPEIIAKLLQEENRHGRCILTPEDRSYRSLSSGERAKKLLDHILRTEPDELILVNPWDSLDASTRNYIQAALKSLAPRCRLLFFVYREADIPDYVDKVWSYSGNALVPYRNKQAAPAVLKKLPPPPSRGRSGYDVLVKFNGVSVSYNGKPILRNINWTVDSGDFWEIRGPNGSGKTTLISMITGDNYKGYGQDITLFDKKKGSGESIWEIKKELGYVSPAMTDLFKGYHSCENMLISGLADSIGLYRIPSSEEMRLAAEWLEVIGMQPEAKTYFHELDTARQRLLLCARAMIKQPALLILDEPTAGLDDAGAAVVVSLVNRLAKDSDRAVVFVSHRQEPGLQARSVLELIPGPEGSIGRVRP